MDRATFALPRVASPKASAHQDFIPISTWARRRLGNIDHEKRVFHIAGALFDMTRDLHGLGRRSRWALHAASLVHDVGRSIDPDHHPAIGSEMLLEDTTLGFTAEVRRSLAYLTLYHRGAVPEAGDDEVLRSSDDREGLYKVLALLRAADTLDCRSIDPPRLVIVRRDHRLRVSCLLEKYTTRAEKAFRRRKKFRLLEETLDCKFEVEVRPDRDA